MTRTFIVSVHLSADPTFPQIETYPKLFILDMDSGLIHQRTLPRFEPGYMLTAEIMRKFRQAFPNVGGLHGEAIEYESHPYDMAGIKVYRVETDD